MKKKYVLGSVLVTLLMLVSSIAVVNTVISDPTPHTGEGFVGDLWLSELDVSSDLENYDDIGIGHTEAEDDWVKWLGASGNITANWSTDINSQDHPEMNVTYSLYIFLVETNNSEIGNTSIKRTYSEDRRYDQSGVLTVPLTFDEGITSKYDEVTLVCKLDALITHNATSEIQNLTCWAQDRAVVGVSFTNNSLEEPFTRFLNESNEEWPIMWAWLDGWNNSGRFSSEDDMLNSQTFFKVGAESLGSTGSNGWYLGTMTIELFKDDSPVRSFSAPLSGNRRYTVNPDETTGRFEIECYMNVKVKRMESGAPRYIWVKYQFWKENGLPAWPLLIFFRCEGGDLPNGITTECKQYFKGKNTDDIEPDNVIDVTPNLFWTLSWPVFPPNLLPTYWIDIDETGTQNVADESNTYWEDLCAYNNGSYSLTVSNSTTAGITTVSVDVSNALTNDELIYSFSGDSGDVKISFTC